MRTFILFLCMGFFVWAAPAIAKPKTHTYQASPDQVFKSAMHVISEHHVVQYVDKDARLVVFQTGASAFSSGFNCNLKVAATKNHGESLVTLNVQKKAEGFNLDAGDRLADNLFRWMQDDLDEPKPQSASAAPSKP